MAGPRFLILETSGHVGQVAVSEGETLRASRRLDEARRHARDLAPAVAELLAGQGWRPRDLDAVVVSRGPGSYTGLRVGIMSAKALAYATGCTLLAIDTFHAVALQFRGTALHLDVLADAQQGKVYVQRFARPDAAAEFAPAGPLAIRPTADWLAERDEATAVSGTGLRLWEQRLPPGAVTADAADREPRPESLLRLGLARFRAGRRDDVYTVEPLYLRPSAAEEKAQRGGPTG